MPRLQQARAAGSVVFFANGLVFASLVPRLPEIKESLGLGAAAYGLVIAAAPAGALALGLLAPLLLRLVGTARVACFGMTVVAAGYLLAGISPTASLFALALFVAGGLDAVVDVAQNSHALRVQRLTLRSIITSFHAVWSLGSLAGGIAGTLAAAAGVPVGLQLATVAVLVAVTLALAYRWMLPDVADDDTPPPGVAPPADLSATAATPGAGGRRAWFVVAVCAVIGLAGAAVEDAGSTWAPVHLRESLGAGPGLAGAAFVVFTAGMVLGRLVGDRVVDALGRSTVVRAGGVGVAVGMAVAGLAPVAWASLAGFALAGLSTSVLIPLAMDVADSVPGLRPGVGLTVVSWLMRAAMLFSPVIIGAVAEQIGVGRALLLVSAAGLVAVAATLVLPAEQRARR